MSTQTSSTTQRRKVARIVFDRPPLKTMNFVLFSLAGLVGGILIALLLHFLAFGIGDKASPEFPAVLVSAEPWAWYAALGLTGLLGGMALGWGWGRKVDARLEEVDVPDTPRRYSVSTALVRAELGRRW